MILANSLIRDPVADLQARSADPRRALGPPVNMIDDAARKSLVLALFAEGLGAPNELDFRKAVAVKLAEKNYAPQLRRALMGEAIRMYRAVPLEPQPRRLGDPMKKAVARGGFYHRRIPKDGGGYDYVYTEQEYKDRPDAHLDGKTALTHHLHMQVGQLIDRYPTGCPIEHFKPLVERHGHQTIAKVLTAHKVSFDGKHVRRTALGKAEDASTTGEQFSTSGVFGNPADPHARRFQVGTRREWHGHIVEKQMDGQWKIVGSATSAGTHPALDPKHLSPAVAKQLLDRIRAHQQAAEATRATAKQEAAKT